MELIKGKINNMVDMILVVVVFFYVYGFVVMASHYHKGFKRASLDFPFWVNMIGSALMVLAVIFWPIVYVFQSLFKKPLE